MDFLPPVLANYIESNSAQEPQILQDLNRETHLKVLQPRMLSGAYQGRLLAMLSHLIKPKRVLELGTFTGYSAICIAEGMKEGEIMTLESNEELQGIASKYFKRFNNEVNQHISFNQIIADAKESLRSIEGTFDLVFLDADKQSYLDYLDLILPLVDKGACIISDNVLWSGKITDEVKKDDLQTLTLQKFNQKLNTHSRLMSVILPVRDGLTLSFVKE
jgi:predicted O-methyltransferase YrrM